MCLSLLSAYAKICPCEIAADLLLQPTAEALSTATGYDSDEWQEATQAIGVKVLSPVACFCLQNDEIGSCSSSRETNASCRLSTDDGLWSAYSTDD